MAHPLKRPRLVLLSLALAVVALIGVACAPSATPAPLSTPGASPTVGVAPTNGGAPTAAAAPTGASGATAAPSAGTKNPLEAATRHFKGDASAPVVLIEASDFQ